MAEIGLNQTFPRLRPILAVTPGEPAGVGPDICIQSLVRAREIADLVYFCDPQVILDRAKALNIAVNINETTDFKLAPDALNIYPVSITSPVIAGELDASNASYVLECLGQAVKACLGGATDALVTGPINKAVINDAGIPFTGHTEWLAARTGTRKVVMMLCSGSLRVVLATTHLPLREVAATITREGIDQVIRITIDDLKKKFGIPDPHILVCGLNPHAGENGHLGTEEIEIIAPAIAQLKQEGYSLTGPVPADTAFTVKSLAGVDAVLAMYHDQGLPVLKHAGFGEAVNITLGLPIIRTSVDHGTALDIAGSGSADFGSLLAAIQSARDIVEQHLNNAKQPR